MLGTFSLYWYELQVKLRRAVSRDPGASEFPADEFHPERFLSATPPPDPSVYAFGVGRRY